MDALDLAISFFATLYLAVVVSNEAISGPKNILNKLRRWAGVKNDAYGNPDYASGSLADLITCPYCNSLWIGIIVVVVFYLMELAGWPARLLLAPLAAGGFVVLVQELKS